MLEAKFTGKKFDSNSFNPFSANSTKWSSTLKQFVGKFQANYSSVRDHFMGLALKGLMPVMKYIFMLYFLLVY